MNNPEAVSQIANEVEKQQTAASQSITDGAAGLAEVGVDVADEAASSGIFGAVVDVMDVGVAVLDSAGEILGGLTDGI